MNDAIIQAVETTLANGWTGLDATVVPDHIRDGYIEATYYATSEDKGTPIRIHVEVVEP